MRVCLAHMNRDHPERALQIMQRFPLVYTDTSWQPAKAIRRAIDTAGPDRILLGSDWPLLHPELQGESLDILRHATSARELDQIGRANAERFLGVEPRPAVHAGQP